jgi:hypothetical protein
VAEVSSVEIAAIAMSTASAILPRALASRLVRCGSPTVEVTLPRTFAPTDDETDRPQDEKDNCHDPQEVEGEAKPSEQQDDEKCQ